MQAKNIQNQRLLNLTELVKKLPLKPGVYIFKNKIGKILYIGKAKSLQKRVSWYFTQNHQDKTSILVKQIFAIDTIITSSEVDALILEAKMIQKNQPKFNIDLKNGSRYAHLLLTNEEFPRLLTIRSTKTQSQGKYFGPFTDGTARETSAKLLRSIFKIRTCGKKLPNKACLQYYLGNCLAPCIGNIGKTDYNNNVLALTSVLQGETINVCKNLYQEMQDHSNKMQFEFAKIKRDQIRSLQKFSIKQQITVYQADNEDILNYIESIKKVYIQIFHLEKGQVTGKEEFILDISSNTINEFVRQYYLTRDVPKVLIMPEHLREEKLLQTYLSKLKGQAVRISVPKIGRKKQLLDLVKASIFQAMSRDNIAMTGLQATLNLADTPFIIECFDISVLSGQYNVGAMVQFKNGYPNNRNYRKYRIKSVSGQNDFASIQEVVKRRYSRLLNEKKALPDLVVIDGGRGQLGMACQALRDLGLHLPIISLAKKKEEIYMPNQAKPLVLPRSDPGLKLLIRVRDETHRYVINYHRLLRKKGTIYKEN